MPVQDIVLRSFPASTDEPPRFHVPIFSSFFFSKDRRFPRIQVCRGDRECGRQQATFEVASCGKEYNSKKKLSCETLSEFLLNMRLFSSNDFDSCMENLHTKELCQDWLRPCSVSSPLNSSSGCAKNGKVSCRQRHPQQAAKDPFLKALTARVRAPASFSQ
jgi:hypothetical protein